MPDNLDIIQHPIHFEEAKIKVKAGKKLPIPSANVKSPEAEGEYAFFGRIKALSFVGTPDGSLFETMEIYYGLLWRITIR